MPHRFHWEFRADGRGSSNGLLGRVGSRTEELSLSKRGPVFPHQADVVSVLRLAAKGQQAAYSVGKSRPVGSKTKMRFCPFGGWREMCPFPCVSSTSTAFPAAIRLTSPSLVCAATIRRHCPPDRSSRCVCATSTTSARASWPIVVCSIRKLISRLHQPLVPKLIQHRGDDRGEHQHEAKSGHGVLCDHRRE